MYIPDESAGSLRSAILLTTSMLHTPSSIVRVVMPQAFSHSERLGPLLLMASPLISVVSRMLIRTLLQRKIIRNWRLSCSGKTHLEPVSALQLDKAACSLNSRICNRGLSAGGILFSHDQLTCEQLDINDKQLCALQESIVVKIISQVPSLKHRVDLKRNLPTLALVI